MEGTFARCLDVIDEALKARRVLVISLTKGVQEKVDGGPDFYAQLTAVKHFRDLCLANRPTPKEEIRKPGVWTLEDLRELQRVLGGTNGIES
jgi:hypothetical protein